MVIKRIGPLSLAKIAGLGYAILGLVFGACFSLIALAGFAASKSGGVAAGALVGVGAIIILPILYGAIGFVMTLVSAWLYNVLAGMLGGVHLDVE